MEKALVQYHEKIYYSDIEASKMSRPLSRVGKFFPLLAFPAHKITILNQKKKSDRKGLGNGRFQAK
jgi:hypothetical protein